MRIPFHIACMSLLNLSLILMVERTQNNTFSVEIKVDLVLCVGLLSMEGRMVIGL